MTITKWSLRASRTACTIAVAALLGVTARAAAQDAAPKPASEPELAKENTVEIGVGDVGTGSYKAGEYNGLESKGAFLLTNINASGRVSDKHPNGPSWKLRTADLGLDTRGVSAGLGIQGRFGVAFGYDGILRNRSDSYQNPFGGNGTDTLTLPGNWLAPVIAGSSGSNSATTIVSARGLITVIGIAPYLDVRTTSPQQGALLQPNASQAALVNAAAAADLAAFHNVNLFTKRDRYDAGVNFHLNDQWSVNASYRPEHKDGMKPMGTVSRNTGGDISTIIPDKIDQDHKQGDASLRYDGSRAFGQMGYYRSEFRNNVRSISWQNWATGPTGAVPGTVNTMGSAPSNDFHQYSASGGVKISSTTRLVVSGSHGRSTQNDAFLTDSTTPIVPVASLNGVVVSNTFNTKLSTRLWKRLSLSGGYKYDNRDNRTPVNIYQYADAGEAPAVNNNFPAGPNNLLGAVVAQNANANRPYGRKLSEGSADADYSLGGGQWVSAGYDFQRINRGCSGSWIDCADVAKSDEKTGKVEWRTSLAGNFVARVGYAYSSRRGTYNENAFLALVPYANVAPASATGGASAYSYMIANGLTGYGPALGFANTTGNTNQNLFFGSNNALANALYANNNRISEISGFRRYYAADRNRDKVRTSLAWQANETWSVQGVFALNKDAYPNTTLGLQDSRGWNSDVDVTYSPTDNFNVNVFYTYERLRSLSDLETYTANSNTATITNGQPGIVGLSNNACDGYTTLQQRNNNNKIDPCLAWSSNTRDRVHSVGVGVTKKQGKLDLGATVTFERARSDNDVAGGNWANNLLDGPGAAPTTYAAVLVSATPFPTVHSNNVEARLTGTWAISGPQSLRIAYAFLRLTSSDWVYDSMQIGTGTLSGVLPSSEAPFNYKVSVVAVSYLLRF